MSPNSNGIIPDAARRDLHNLPSFTNKGVAIDMVEFPEMDHIGIRVYLNQIDPLDVQERLRVIERMFLIQKVLQSYGISCSLEKVAGNPPVR